MRACCLAIEFGAFAASLAATIGGRARDRTVLRPIDR
jgi:hypothetical protein